MLWKTLFSCKFKKFLNVDHQSWYCDNNCGAVLQTECARHQRELESRKAAGGVDYSWLVAATPKTYEMPQLERLEIEELCLKVRKFMLSSFSFVFPT